MATTLSLIFGALFMFITTLVIVGVTARRITRKTGALDAKAPKALLPVTRDELAGWSYVPDPAGQVIEKALVGGWLVRVVWVEREGAREDLTITATREVENMPAGTGYRIGAHTHQLLEPSARRLVWRVTGADMVDIVFDDLSLSVPHEAFVDVLFQRDIPHVDTMMALGALSPASLLVDAQGFRLRGMFEGEVYTLRSLTALEEIVMAYTSWFTWRAHQIEKRGLLRLALTHTRDREAYVRGGLRYAEELDPDEREAYLVDCVLGHPGELHLSRRAFRALIESGRKKKLGEALMGQRLDLHRWLVDLGEVEALLWLIEDEQQQAAWLGFLLQNPPAVPRNHNDIEGHKRITEWGERLALIPSSLLASPRLAAQTRQHVLHFALAHWQGTYTLALVKEMAQRYEGEALRTLLWDALRVDGLIGATVAVEVMVNHRAPSEEIRELMFAHLPSVYHSEQKSFRDAPCMPWLHDYLLDEDALIRHEALALVREMGDVDSLRFLLELRKSGAHGLDHDALGTAIDKLFALYGEELSGFEGQLTLASTQGGELSVARAQRGEIELSE